MTDTTKPPPESEGPDVTQGNHTPDRYTVTSPDDLARLEALEMRVEALDEAVARLAGARPDAYGSRPTKQLVDDFDLGRSIEALDRAMGQLQSSILATPAGMIDLQLKACADALRDVARRHDEAADFLDEVRAAGR